MVSGGGGLGITLLSIPPVKKLVERVYRLFCKCSWTFTIELNASFAQPTLSGLLLFSFAGFPAELLQNREFLA
jgi:hypothetical protein